MTQAFNLSQLANKVDSSGRLNVTTGLIGSVPIANGGTGQTTANTALNALLPSQAGNVGEVLKTDGTNTSWQPVFSQAQFFTTNGTFTVPPNVTAVKVTVVGGGGAGGQPTNGSGGGGGGTAIKWLSGLTPGSTVSVVVGIGGSTAGASGGTSTFGAFCSASGGAGGVVGHTGAGGNGGVGSNGTINIAGGGGGGGAYIGYSPIPTGGSSFMGGGGASAGEGNGAVNGKNGGNYGGGGSGSGALGYLAGYGANGCVLVEY